MQKNIVFFMPVPNFFVAVVGDELFLEVSWKFVSILFLLVSTVPIAAQTVFVYAAIALCLWRNGIAFTP